LKPVLLILIGIALFAQSPDQIRVALPGQPWALEVTAPAFKVTQNVTQPGGRQYMQANLEAEGFVVSVTLEKVDQHATLDGCRDVFRGRIAPSGPFKLTNVKQSQQGEMAILEYLIPEANGLPVQQKNVFGCLARNDAYADIHVSKVSFKPADQARLMAILSSASFVETTAATSEALFAEGSKYFLQNDYVKAIAPYQRAVDLEKKERKLDTPIWRVLVDNLAMAYGITGNLRKSDDVIQYGLSEDPTYPMFYFIRADSYAEQNDLIGAMKNLRLALENRRNMNPGEALPDPMSDDSFKKFWNDEDFKKLAAQFK
jgi:tetratricopeptide (TPR) repeat protein